jgi:regulatory protein
MAAPGRLNDPVARDALALALKMLGRRDYSRSELATRLGQRFETDPTPVLDWLSKKGYLDDRRFARGFLRSHPGWARPRTDAALEARGVAAAVRQEVLDEVAWPSVTTIVKDRMRLMRLKAPLTRATAARLAGALVRAGYDPAEVGEELGKLL